MNLKINFKTGISLVALVVTIVVLIIMSGAVILSFNKTNILDQAEYAAERQKVAFLQEKITMEKQNEMLSRFETTHSNVATQNKTITVQELLNVTEEDALNIVEANSIPANMPAGTYYELDSNRYSSRLRNQRTNLALLSRGVDRENDLITNTYVVSENFVVYYIIDGKTGEPQTQINDERVIELLTGDYTDENIMELKKELNINNIESNNTIDFLFALYNEKNEENEILFYFYTIDRMYSLDLEKEQFKYISKEDRTLSYEYAKKACQILSELKTAFIGRTENELDVMNKNGTLNSYILEKCSSIKTISAICKADTNYTKIRELTFEFNGKTYNDFCDYNTFYFITDENGKYINVYLESGS